MRRVPFASVALCLSSSPLVEKRKGRPSRHIGAEADNAGGRGPWVLGIDQVRLRTNCLLPCSTKSWKF
jgi:hypothetical protein